MTQLYRMTQLPFLSSSGNPHQRLPSFPLDSFAEVQYRKEPSAMMLMRKEEREKEKEKEPR